MRKPDLLLWTGPVWAGNLAGTKWYQPTEILSLSCEGSNNCAAIATNLPQTGMLDALLKSKGKSADDYDKIMLAGFSAGHGFSDRMLRDQASRERLAAYASFDSYYTGAAPGIKLGVMEFAKLAAAGKKLMWSSASENPDRTWLSCEDSIQPLLDALDMSRGTLPGKVASMLAQQPKYVRERGGFIHANYGLRYKHGEHATIIGPAVLGGWLSPGVHGVGVGSSWGWWLLGCVAAGAAAYGAYRLGGSWAGRRSNPVGGETYKLTDAQASFIEVDVLGRHFCAPDLDEPELCAGAEAVERGFDGAKLYVADVDARVVHAVLLDAINALDDEIEHPRGAVQPGARKLLDGLSTLNSRIAKQAYAGGTR